MNREVNIEHARTGTFDLCIIGGGITGAGLLAGAARRGWKVVLIERSDLAAGSSSHSAKIIHGGIRYLKYFRFRLVREALRERGFLLKQFPHLVTPIPFLLPAYGSTAQLFFRDFLLSLYDLLAGEAVIFPHRKLDPEEVLRKLPGLESGQLKGGILYWEAYTHDARLAIETISHFASGERIILNYTEALRIAPGAARGRLLICRDRLLGKEFPIRARVYINATGVWTDDVLQRLTGSHTQRMKPSKGIHLLVPSGRLPETCACVIPSVSGDGRYLYALPWENGLTILGTTDTEYTGSPDEVKTTEEEVLYVLEAFNASFPRACLSAADVTATYAGLRPLLSGHRDTGSYSRSREYQWWWSGPDLVTLAGGKLTSFLSMGERCMAAVEQKLKDFRRSPAVPQQTALPRDELPGQAMFRRQQQRRAEIEAENAAYRLPLSAHWPLTVAQVLFFVRCQFARQVEDVLTRRTTLTYAMKVYDEGLVAGVARIMAGEFQLGSGWIEAQTQAYRRHWSAYHPDFITAAQMPAI